MNPSNVGRYWKTATRRGVSAVSGYCFVTPSARASIFYKPPICRKETANLPEDTERSIFAFVFGRFDI
jgi:hypothetical protein